MSKPITPYEDAIKKSIILYNSPEFERIADEFTMDMYVYVKEKFPGIQAEVVQRKKSIKSIYGKILNKELERLSKGIYLGVLDLEDNEEYFKTLVSKRMRKVEKFDDKKIERIINNYLSDNIINTKTLEELKLVLENEEIDEETKKILYRVLIAKIRESNRQNREQEIKQLEKESYDIYKIKKRSIAQREKAIKDARYSTFEQELFNAEEFLTLRDIYGMKCVINVISDNFEWQEEPLKTMLQDRLSAKTLGDDVRFKELDNEVKIILSKIIAAKVSTDQEFMDKHGLIHMEDKRKSHNKPNGYRAEHLSYLCKDNTSYRFEWQLKSDYCDMVAHDGTAAHTQRSGKKRVLPKNNPDNPNFNKEIKFMIPKYKVVQETGRLYRCSDLENFIYYFQKNISEQPEYYDEIMDSKQYGNDFGYSYEVK